MIIILVLVAFNLSCAFISAVKALEKFMDDDDFWIVHCVLGFLNWFGALYLILNRT